MKRLVIGVLGAVFLALLLVFPAFAQSDLPPPSPSPTVSPSVSPTVSPSVSPTASPSVSPTVSPSVSPTVSPSVSPSVSPTATESPSPSPTVEILPSVIVTPPGGVAFAGFDVTVWMVLAVALLVLGVTFLIAARRRARRAGD